MRRLPLLLSFLYPERRPICVRPAVALYLFGTMRNGIEFVEKVVLHGLASEGPDFAAAQLQSRIQVAILNAPADDLLVVAINAVIIAPGERKVAAEDRIMGAEQILPKKQALNEKAVFPVAMLAVVPPKRPLFKTHMPHIIKRQSLR